MKKCSLSLMLLAIAPAAVAGQCEDKARPAQFNKDTAMEAIFCEYNLEHGGTLIPLANTKQWGAVNSETLITPKLAVTYQEGNTTKGVLVAQRQMLEHSGEPVTSHGQGAVISVYVFEFNGMNWIFEKGGMNITTAGAWGAAPSATLAKIGPEKHGLYFESGSGGQGYYASRSFIISLSEKKISVAGDFDTGESNSGTCSDNPKERDEMIGACWSYEGKVEFVEMPGSSYDMLRVIYQGTQQKDINDQNKIAPKNTSMCYIFSGNRYVRTADRNCAKYKARDTNEIFGASKN